MFAWRRNLDLLSHLAAARQPSTIAMILDLLTERDAARVPIRLALDVGHMCVPGTADADRDPYAWLSELGRVAFEIQLQQSDAEGDHHWPFMPEANARGRIVADRVIDALGESGVEDLALILKIIPGLRAGRWRRPRRFGGLADYWLEALARHGVLAA